MSCNCTDVLIEQSLRTERLRWFQMCQHQRPRKCFRLSVTSTVLIKKYIIAVDATSVIGSCAETSVATPAVPALAGLSPAGTIMPRTPFTRSIASNNNILPATVRVDSIVGLKWCK